jgi:biotin transporter BioY
MFDQLTDKVADKAAQTAQTAALGLGASLCLVVGCAFLTGALWLYLLTVTTTLVACVIMGAIFTGVGLVMIALMSARSRNRKHQKREEFLRYQAQQKASVSNGLEGVAGVIAAFINGLNAGKKARF